MNILLNEALLGSKHISHAGILRRNDGHIKARSPNFSMTPADWARIQAAFDNPKDARGPDSLVTVMDMSYKPVRCDALSIYAKSDKCGLIVCRTNGLCIVCTYEANMYAAVAVESAEKLAEYFRKKDK